MNINVMIIIHLVNKDMLSRIMNESSFRAYTTSPGSLLELTIFLGKMAFCTTQFRNMVV